MNPKTIIRFLVQHAFGSVIRHGLVTLGAWMSLQGWGVLSGESQANIAELVIGAICAGLGLAWSVVRSHLSAKQIGELAKSLSAFGVFSGMRKDDVQIKLPPPATPPTNVILWLIAAHMAAFSMGCSTVTKFDQNSYESAQALKSESLALILRVYKDPANYRDDISALKAKLAAQLAYEQGKGPANVISAKQWEVLISPQHNLLGRLLQDFETDRPRGSVYITEKSQQIASGFDQILKLEGRKIK